MIVAFELKSIWARICLLGLLVSLVNIEKLIAKLLATEYNFTRKNSFCK